MAKIVLVDRAFAHTTVPRSDSPQLARIAAGECRDGGRVEDLDRSDVAGRLGFGHVERVVAAHDYAVGAEQPHQLSELVRRERLRVEINLLEVAGGRLRQRAVRVRARPPGMVDATRIGRQEAATMYGQD